MSDCDEWLAIALAHRPTVYEYCQLALRPSLDETAAERLGDILCQAEADPLLSFLIDEADALVARLQSGCNDELLRQQQERLRAALGTLGSRPSGPGSRESRGRCRRRSGLPLWDCESEQRRSPR